VKKDIKLKKLLILNKMDYHKYTERWIDGENYNSYHKRNSRYLDYLGWIPKIFLIIVFIAIIWSVYNQRVELGGIFNQIKDSISEKGVVENLRDSGTIKPKINEFELEERIHQLINEERTKQGLKKLSYDYNLANIARGHSKDIGNTGVFSHYNLKGEDPTARAKREDYNCHKNFGSYYTEGIAENIFQNNLYTESGWGIIWFIPYWYHDWSTLEEIAQSTVQGWMNSAGHRENILTLTYDKEGIGVSISSDDKVFITQNFC